MRRAWLFLAAILGVGCGSSSSGGGDGAPACVTPPPADCQSLYDPPSYQTIFDQTFRRTCGVGSGTCHTSDAAKGGLVFEDADVAYGLLMGTIDGRKRVIPRDPGCSLLMERIESTDPSFQMPPGDTPLSAPAQCAISKWIAGGAAR